MMKYWAVKISNMNKLYYQSKVQAVHIQVNGLILSVEHGDRCDRTT